MGLKKWNMNFYEECSDQESRTNFSDTLLLPETFHCYDLKSLVLFTFQLEFQETF